MPIEIKIRRGKVLTDQEKKSVAMLKAMLERRDELLRERAQKQAAQQQTPPANPKH